MRLSGETSFEAKDKVIHWLMLIQWLVHDCKHHAADSPNNFPLPVSYKALTNKDVSAACHKMSSTVVTVAKSS